MKFPEVLKNNNYSKLFCAGTISELGSFVTETALMLLVFKLSGNDKSYLGIIRTCFLVCLTLGSICGGPIGEKFNRKNILIYCNVLRFPAILSLLYIDDIHYIIFVNGYNAFFTGIFNPSRQTVVNEIVSKDNINEANSLFGSALAVLHMLGPFLGATLFAYFSGVSEILIFDLATYIVGIYLLFNMKYVPPLKSEIDNDSFFQKLSEGFAYVNKSIQLKTMLLNIFFTGFCIGILIPLILPFISETYGKGDTEFGILLSLFGLGGVVGGWACTRISKIMSTGKILVSFVVTEPLLMFLWIYAPNFVISSLLFFIWGIVVFVRITAQLNYLSENVETEFLTRLHSLIDMAFVIPNISGSLLIAMFGNQFTSHKILLIATIAFSLLIYPRLFMKGMRTLFKETLKTS